MHATIQKALLGGVLILQMAMQQALLGQACAPRVPPIKPPNLPPNSDTSSETVNAQDPNEKRGPSGFGAGGFLATGASLPYRIKFENLGPGSTNASGVQISSSAWASAPAQEVEVTDTLSPNLDWSTVRISGFGFGDVLQAVQPPRSAVQLALPVVISGKSFKVQFEAAVGMATGRLCAVFRSIDPQTSLPPDVLTGFLPPEDGTGIGQGFIEYTVEPKAGLPSGTEIRNVALITFDRQRAIATDQIDPMNPGAGVDPKKQALITIDADPPSSAVVMLPPVETDEVFPVSWIGSDVGAGIASYDIVVSTNGGPWGVWLSGTTNTSAYFQGHDGDTYGFYSIARDQVGYLEPAPPTADTTTRVDAHAPPPVLSVSLAFAPNGQDLIVTLTYPVRAGRTHTVEFRVDLGPNGTWQPLPGAPHNSGTVTDSPLNGQRYYRVRMD